MVVCFGYEVCVWGMCYGDVGFLYDEVLGVELVISFWYVGLVVEYLRVGWGKIGILVVEV